MFKKVLILSSIVCSTTIFSAASLAQNDAKGDTKSDAKESQWSGDIELGYIYKSGNTNEETALLRQSIIYHTGNWLNTVRLKGDYGKEDGSETSKAYYVTEQLDYKVAGTKNYSFLRGSYDRDLYNGFEYQGTAVVGYGNHVVEKKDVSLKLELGLGYRDERYDAVNTEVAIVEGRIHKNTEMMAYFSNELVFTVSDAAEIGQSISIEYGNNNTVSRFNLYVKSNIIENVAVKVSYAFKHNTIAPPADPIKLDQDIITSLLYTF